MKDGQVRKSGSKPVLTSPLRSYLGSISHVKRRTALLCAFSSASDCLLLESRFRFGQTYIYMYALPDLPESAAVGMAVVIGGKHLGTSAGRRT
jgi:hypothetical protein